MTDSTDTIVTEQHTENLSEITPTSAKKRVNGANIERSNIVQISPDDAPSAKAATNLIVSCLKSMPRELAMKAYMDAAKKMDLEFQLSPSMSDTAIAKVLVETFPELQHVARHKDGGDLWRYNGRHWEEFNEDRAKSLLARILSANTYSGVSSRKIETILKAITYLSGERPMRRPGLIAYNNGVYDTKTGDFFSHHPDFGIEGTLPCDYDPEPSYPSTFVNFLEQSCANRDERMELMLAQYKYHFENRIQDQIYFENIGDGGCGLSTHQAVLTAILGKGNISATGLDRLDGRDSDKFATAELVGKLAWIIPDAKQIASTCSTLKAITGADEVQIRPLNKKGYSTILPMTVSYFGNAPIISQDRSGGLMRRRRIIKLDQVVPEEQKDSNLVQKLINELPGIIAFVQDQLPESKYREVISGSNHGSDKMQVMSETESLIGWLAQSVNITFNDADFSAIGSKIHWEKSYIHQKLERARTKLFENYLLWCEVNGIDRPIKSGFDKALEDTVNLKLSTEGKRLKRERKRSDPDQKNAPSSFIGLTLKMDAEHLEITSEQIEAMQKEWTTCNS